MVFSFLHSNTSGMATERESCGDKPIHAAPLSPCDRNGMKIYRIHTGKLLANGQLAIDRSLSHMDVPLCSFGPGGEYVVDWYAHRYRPQQLENQEDTKGEIFSPLKLLFREMRDVFLGIHPGRRYRIESRPDLLEPCPTCRRESQYSPWINALRPAVAPPVAERYTSEKAVAFAQPVLAKLPVPVSATDRTLRRAMADAGAGKAVKPHIMEKTDDTNAETIGDSYRYPGLPSSAGLFADDAGTRRPARRIQGHRIRTRSGLGAKKADSSGTAQGSLFDCASGSEAA